jgi:hypothetical protein
MFEPKSRYAELESYEVKDRRGRSIKIVQTPPESVQKMLGVHLLRQGQRLDHLAAKYLGDPVGFWRLCEVNNVMLPEALTEAKEIVIPVKER